MPLLPATAGGILFEEASFLPTLRSLAAAIGNRIYQISSDKLLAMKTLTVTEVARNFSAVLDDVERDQKEVLLVRNHRRIARLVPEPPAQTALEVLGDLYRTLDDDTADALSAAVHRSRKGVRQTLQSLRNPWDS